MNKKTTSAIIYEYIVNNYDKRTPIFVKDIYCYFININRNTIRAIFRRLTAKELIVRITDGIYALPSKDSLFGKPIVYMEDVIRNKYIGVGNNIFGYISGINFANQLGLTTQTASVETIISNKVAKKRRLIKLRNIRLIINATRIEVNSTNYKLLQVLDLLVDFQTYSEVNLKKAKTVILGYLSKLKLDEVGIEKIVSTYPRAAQIKFYKMGGQYVVQQ